MPTSVLEAFNPIVGLTAFVAMPLPEPWRFTRATVMPEVATTVRQGDRQWVTAGESRHVVFDRLRRIRLDLVVRVTAGPPRRPLARLAEGLADGALAVGGHAGAFQLGRRREGLLPRRLVPTLRLRHYCDRTRRTVLVELSGAAVLEESGPLLEAMSRLECHGP